MNKRISSTTISIKRRGQLECLRSWYVVDSWLLVRDQEWQQEEGLSCTCTIDIAFTGVRLELRWVQMRGKPEVNCSYSFLWVLVPELFLLSPGLWPISSFLRWISMLKSIISRRATTILLLLFIDGSRWGRCPLFSINGRYYLWIGSFASGFLKLSSSVILCYRFHS